MWRATVLACRITKTATILQLSTGEDVSLATEADALFYSQILERGTADKTYLGKDLVDTRLDACLDLGCSEAPQPGSLYVHYLGRLTSDQPVTDPSLDNVQWPICVLVRQGFCLPQGLSLCGWHALANALDAIALAWVPILQKFPIDTFDPIRLCEVLDIRAGQTPDIEDDYMQWLLQKRGPFRRGDKTRTIRDVAEDPADMLCYTEQEMSLLGSSCGVLVVAAAAAQVVAFSRLTSCFSDASLSRVLNFRDEHAEDVSQYESMVTELTAAESVSYVTNVFGMWPIVRASCCGSEDCYPFIGVGSRAADSPFVPPGVLIYDQELLQYPGNVGCIVGRTASFVVNTIFPALCAAADTAGTLPSIDIRVQATGELTVLDNPSWMQYGHWISATLDVLEGGVWSWTVKDSLNCRGETDTVDRYIHVIRELTILILGVFRARALWARMHFGVNLI